QLLPIEPVPELDHHRQRAFHVGGAAAVDPPALAPGGKVALLERNGVEVAGQNHGWFRVVHPPGDDRVADPLAAHRVLDVGGDRALVADRTADLTELQGARGEVHRRGHTETPKSRSAELSEVFLSVLSLRVPMISA